MLRCFNRVAFAGALSASIVGFSITANAADAEPVSFKGKTVSMIIGFPPGGGTDASGRLIANYLGKYLPGGPTVVSRNMPGVDGITALNYLVQQTKPDGLTVTMGASTQADPLNYRKASAVYDPSKFGIIGGIGRGGTILLISTEAEKRLHDKSAPPAVIGSIEAIPRSGGQMGAWGIAFLGWNAKWVVGYRGTSDLTLALERHEIDATSTANMFQIEKFTQGGDFKILVQSGALVGGKVRGRPDFGNAPVLPELMEGKISDALGQAAFKYWQSISSIDKWVALAPNTPPEILATYREAFKKVGADPQFVADGKRLSEDFTPMAQEDVEILINTLASTPPEAMDYIAKMLQKQGLRAE